MTNWIEILAIVVGAAAAEPRVIQAATDSGYALIVAKGNKETFLGRQMTKGDCEAKRDEFKATTKAMWGAENALGSVTCIPEEFILPGQGTSE